MSRKFQSIRDEVMGQYGYDSMEQGPVAAGNSTQDLYAAKTMMRCDSEYWFAFKNLFSRLKLVVIVIGR